MRYGLAATALLVFSFVLQAALFLAALFICRFDHRPLTGMTGPGDYRNLAIAYGGAGDIIKARY